MLTVRLSHCQDESDLVSPVGCHGAQFPVPNTAAVPNAALPNADFNLHCSRYAETSLQIHTSYVRRLGEVHVVDSVDEVLRGDALASEEAAVQALDGVYAALDTVKFDVDLSVSGTRSNTDVHNLPVFVVALFLDVLFELLVPSGLLSASTISQFAIFATCDGRIGLLVLCIEVLEQDTAAW